MNFISNTDYEKLKKFYFGLNSPFHRADKAILRRIETLKEIMKESIFFEFKKLDIPLFKQKMNFNNEICALGCILGLLPHIKKIDERNPFAAQLRGNGKVPLVSEIRFNNLLKVDNWEDLYFQLRRLVVFTENINLISLANYIFHWAYELEYQNYFYLKPSESLKFILASDYYQVRDYN